MGRKMNLITKLIGFAGVTVTAFFFNHPGYQAALLGLTLAVFFGLKIPAARVKPVVYPLLPFLFLIGATAAFFPSGNFYYSGHRHILLYLLPKQELGLSVGGIMLGLTYIMRIGVMLLGTLIVTETSSLEDFLALFQRLRLPDGPAFALATALRFIPVLDQKRRHILEAQKARGARLNENGLIGAAKASIPIMVPLMVQTILAADGLAMAMLNRGYGNGNAHVAWGRPPALSWPERAIVVLVLTGVGLGFYVRFYLQWGIL